MGPTRSDPVHIITLRDKPPTRHASAQAHYGIWCLSNVAIEQDAAGNVKISKARSRDKVDGAVALAMAVGVAATEGHSRSVYEERPSFVVI